MMNTAFTSSLLDYRVGPKSLLGHTGVYSFVRYECLHCTNSGRFLPVCFPNEYARVEYAYGQVHFVWPGASG